MSSCSLEYLGIPPLILPKNPVNCVNPVIPPENRKEILLEKCKSFFDEKNEIDSLKNTVDELKKGVEGVNKLYANNRVDIDRISRNTEELKTLNREIEEEFNRTLKNNKILGQQHREIEAQHIKIDKRCEEVKKQHEEIKEGFKERARLNEEIEAGFYRIREGIKEVKREQEKNISDQVKMLQEVDKMILEMEEFNRRLKEQEAERALLENRKNITDPDVEEEFKEPLEVIIPKNITVATEICDENQTLTEKPFEKEKENERNDAKEMDFLADELIADLNKGIEQKSDEVMVPLEESPSLKKTLFFFITAPLYLGLFIVQGLKIVFFLADRIYSRIGKLTLWK